MLCLSGLCSIAGKVDGGSRTEEEEKVYSWLYTLAQSEKNLVFEYVRSTERGKYLHSAVLFQWTLILSHPVFLHTIFYIFSIAYRY